MVGDCAVRAIIAAFNSDWDKIYLDLCVQGLIEADMPSSNQVWGSYLKKNGYKRHFLPDTCPDCYTVRDFCNDYPKGTYILGTGSHVITVKDGNYYDSWDSGNKIPLYYWTKEE